MAPSAAVQRTTGVYLDGEPNEEVSAGDQWILGPPDHSITAPEADPSHASATFYVDGGTWILRFVAPSGEALAEGTTYQATNGVPTQGVGVLWVGGDGRGCARATGALTVHEVQFDGSGLLVHFDADFTQQCDDGRDAVLFGSLRFAALRPLRALTA
ncbi:MAG TPA: hypothetical protein VJ398_10690 [Acidimicrobiia bacterium]|nr:hypothetical protein [Acidimicrobiia bacterium]